MTLPKSSFTDCFASFVGQACNLFLTFLSIFSWRKQHLLLDFGLKLFDKLQESGVCTLRYYLGLMLAIQQRTIPRTILKTLVFRIVLYQDCVTFHSNLLKRKITVHNGEMKQANIIFRYIHVQWTITQRLHTMSYFANQR